MAKGNKKTGESKVPVTQDERFKSVHNDPRFKLPNMKNFKVKVDDRFSEKELQKLNAGATGKKVKIDRYGRKTKENVSNLKKYYEHEEEEEEEEKEDDEEEDKDNKKSDSESGSESDSESDSDAETLVEAKSLETDILDKARGEGLQSSDEDSSSGSDSDSDSDSDSFAEFSEGEESEEEIEAKPEEGDPTSAFAVVNMDWDNIRAVDLMATFASFIPKGGLIKSVSIYPSEFGKEQMQKEEIEGPPKELFKPKKKKQTEEDSDSDIDDIDLNNAEGLEKAARKLYEDDDGTEDYDSKALRRYQLQRLRYYYAVVQCDSVATAQNIYTNCDSTEFESTANIFDLRYVPEDMEFDDEAKDVCCEIPSSYNPNSSFVTDALQHSKVKLTWDETPRERLAISSRQFSQREIDDMDFKAYLASDSDGSDEEKEDAKDKYKSLLGGKFSSSFDKKAQEDEDDVDMEITFNPGLDEKAAAEQQKREQELSTIEAYKQKEKERRKNRMAKMKETQAAEKESEKDAKTKNKKHNKNNNEDSKSKAELELLMMDENEDEAKPDHFNMRDILKAEKQKNKKGKKHNKNIDNEMTQDNFEADLNDPRFNEIFENHEFAIDPTSSEFKKTQTMSKILKERSKRNKHDNGQDKSFKKQKTNTNANNGSELNKLVNKFKRNNK